MKPRPRGSRSPFGSRNGSTAAMLFLLIRAANNSKCREGMKTRLYEKREITISKTQTDIKLKKEENKKSTARKGFVVLVKIADTKKVNTKLSVFWRKGGIIETIA